MKITYERLVNLGNFNNERLSLEDDVQPGETPEAAYQRIRATVHGLLGITDPSRPRTAGVPALPTPRPPDDIEF